jgi:hypothetical protein
MDKPKNNERKIATISLLLCLAFIAGIILPFVISMDMMDGGYALSFFSLFLAISACVTFFVYNARAKSLDRIFSGDLLAQWEYGKKEWQEYAKSEFEQQKKDKKAIWLVILPIAILVGFIFVQTHEGSAFIIICTITALMLLLAFVAFIVPKIKYWSDMRAKPMAFISKSGVYLSGEFHNWDMLMSRLSKADFDKKKSLLSITYSYFASTGPNSYIVRIPVPKAQVKKAEDIVKSLQNKK